MIIKLTLIILNLVFTQKVIASIVIVDKGVLQPHENSIGLRFFLDITNEDRQNSCNLRSECNKCCLTDSKKPDCDTITAFGEDIRIVHPRDRTTLLFVAPMLLQHDLVGFCDVKLNYNSKNTTNNTAVTIPFDTRLNIKGSRTRLEKYIGGKKVTKCHTFDEDTLNNCEPVNCNVKYLDTRPFFDHNVNKCVKAPICLTNPDKELPDYVYIPNSNICRNLDLPLTVQDIYLIRSGLGLVTTIPISTPDVKVKIQSNCSTISQNLMLLRDLMYGKFCPLTKGILFDYSDCIKSVFITIVTCIISLCSLLFLLVCCINTTVWMYLSWSDGKFREIWNNMKNRIKSRKRKSSKQEKVNCDIRNALLREVIIKDIPLDLRNSVLDVCDRIGKEVEKKKRYRTMDIGSQISLQNESDNLMSSSSSIGSENEKK